MQPASGATSRTASLRRLISEPGLVVLPACFDALSARLIEQAGFPAAFMSGFCISAARLAKPDAGLMSYGEVVEQGRTICDAVSIPVLGDADTGFGSAANVKRTVAGFASAGFAATMIEDQVNPKRCGYADGVAIVDRQEALSRMRAAVDARDEGADTLILGRTDAATVMGFEEGLWRAEAYQDMGCDIIYFEGLRTEAELERFARRITVPKMFVAAEGSGHLIPSNATLDQMGIKFVCWAVTLLSLSIKAMSDGLRQLKSGTHPDRLATWGEINDVVGMTAYLAEEKRYR